MSQAAMSRVLVADDDSTLRLLVSAALSPHGFDVETCSDGSQAWAALQANQYDLVLLDVEMPGFNGFALCEKIRRELRSDVPVLLVTGHDDVVSIQRAYDVGATDFIAKPINWPLLGHRLRYVLRSYRTLQSLDQAKARHRAMLRALPDMLLRVTLAGAVVEQHGQQTESRSANVRMLTDLLPADVATQCMESVRLALRSGNVQNIEYYLPDSDEKSRVFEGRIAPVDRDEAICLLRDVTERREADQRIVNLAYFDPLTGLPNRASFQALLSLAVARSEGESERLAVLFLDIDGFKGVNDSFGHATGDHVLQSVAERLRATLRISDPVGRQMPGTTDGQAMSLSRLGGDEFTVLLPNIGRAEDAMLVAQRICAAFAKPFNVDSQEITLSTSVGISVFPDDASSPQLLVKHADTAMYAAKERGRSQAHFYSEALTERALHRFKMETALRRAIERDEFEVYYQPIINAKSERIAVFEALVRWRNPELGLLPPSEFISVAEECGMIARLGRWVLERACRDAVAWNVGLEHPIVVAVNVSALQVTEGGLTSTVSQALDAAGLPAELLELEITESALVDRDGQALDTLRALRAMGVRIALDDFGTGYSSLAYLRELPLTSLKIDRLFVTDLLTSRSDEAIVRSIIALSQNLGLWVVGEGVETVAQQQFLTNLGCGLLQGYLFSVPLPLGDALELLHSQFAVASV
jgi:diguanylate cyclase (GGDEF)-like protein